MQNTDSSHIVGVFRDRAKADNSIEELKQAGFREDQITSAVYGLKTAPGEQTSENTRIVVTVKAEGNDKQAFGILFNNGANNADLPSGMSLKEGNIVNSQAETVELIPEPTVEADFPKHNFFGEVEVPGHSDDFEIPHAAP